MTRAANETHADCLRMIVRAEMRMADEIDRGQQRGDVAQKGGDGGRTNVRAADIEPATFADLGVSRQRLSEWRDVRDAGDDVVEQAITAALADAGIDKKLSARAQQLAAVPEKKFNAMLGDWRDS